MLPAPGEMSATLFLELTNDAQLREWLPQLVGIEHAAEFRIGQPGSDDVVHSAPEAEHGSHLIRETVTSAVHYIRFRITDTQVALAALAALAAGPSKLAVFHRQYPGGADGAASSLAARSKVLADLRGGWGPRSIGRLARAR